MRNHLVLFILLFSLLWLAACKQDSTEPGPLQAGIATARIPAPLGIGTSGYGPFDTVRSVSPFSDIYPATTRLHSHPEIRVVVLSRGPEHELIFVRTDTIGVLQQLRKGLVEELKRRLDKDLDHSLIFGATHTHSGPGRLIAEGGLFDYVADTFCPEFYQRFINALADTVEAAYIDLQPAKAGHVIGRAEGANRNRRCEDGNRYANSSVPAIAIERHDRTEALIFSFAVHGTILGINDLTLSREVSGGIENAIEERFEHPVQVLFFNAWGGDMSPADPDVPVQDGAEIPTGYDRMERVGIAVADALMEAMQDLETTDTPIIESRTYRTKINRQVLGYDDDTFPYDDGALFCGMGDVDCDLAPQVQDGMDQFCIAFPYDSPAPDQTEFTVGLFKDLHFVTFTGEPVTSLAEFVKEGMRKQQGVEDIMFLGYTQDFLGYSLLEEDWWWGGYEASGTLWGPRQGQYLAEFVIESFDAFKAKEPVLGQPPALMEVYIGRYTPYRIQEAIQPGELQLDVVASYNPQEIVSFTVSGTDPWLGAPTAFLETATGEPVLRPNGEPVDSDGFYLWLDLETDPPYKEEASSRRFSWSFSFPITRSFAPTAPKLEGSYRFRVEIPVDESGATIEVTTGTFDVLR